MPSFILIRPTVWPQSTKLQTGQRSDGIGRTVFGRPFVKGFALCYQSVCPVCDVGVLWPNGWTDRDITWRAGRPRHCVRWGPSSPLQRGTVPPPIFGPISVAAKWLHDQDVMVWSQASAQATLCIWGPMQTAVPLSEKGEPPSPIFGPSLLWRNG